MSNFSEIKIYVAADYDDLKGLTLSNDSLDGNRGMVRVRFGEGPDADDAGWYDVDQLIDALETIKNHRIKFLQDRKK